MKRNIMVLFGFFWGIVLLGGGQDMFKVVPDGSDYAVELVPEKMMKVKKISEMAARNPGYAAFKAVFSAKGLDFEKSVGKAMIAGGYHKSASMIFGTTLKEKDFLSLIESRKPETFNISGKKVFKYFEKNKPVFSSYLKDGLLMVSENASLITGYKPLDFGKMARGNFPFSEGEDIMLRGYLRDIPKAIGGNKKGKNNPMSLMGGDRTKECYFEARSADGVNVDAVAYFLSDAKNEKLLQFQVNALFLMLVAKISGGNQALANQITDSFKISSDGAGLVKASFRLNTSLVDIDGGKKSMDELEEDVFDPFSE